MRLRIADCGLRNEGQGEGEGRIADCGLRNEEQGMGQREGEGGNGKKIAELTRREMIRFLSIAVVAVPGTGKRQTAHKPQRMAHQFFTPAEFRLVDELSEMIIPADDHSPGAREAKVAAYLDKTLGETMDTQMKERWREGLKSIDALSQEMHAKTFMNSTPDQRTAVMDRVAQNENDPQQAAEKFFVELKSSVAFAYYTSKIGLRQELEYKGNTYLKEFAGEEV